MLRQLFILLLVLTLSSPVFAQQMFMRKINTDGEIPAHEIYNVFQDSSHYIWFASDAGVWRFDGKEYKGFTAANGLPDNVIFGFFEDKRNRLWLKMYTNKIAFIKNEKITILACSNKLSQLKKKELVSSLYVDDHDTVYVSYMRSNEIIKIAPPYKDNDLQLINIQSRTGHYIYETPSGEILLGSMAIDQPTLLTNDSITLILQRKKIVMGFKNKSLESPRIMLAKQADGSYLIGTGNILLQYRKQQLKELLSFNNSILYAIYDNQNNLWVATTDGGLVQYDKSDIAFAKPTTYFPKDFANCILQDKENSYWIATLKSGLYYAPFNDVTLMNHENGLSQNISCTYFDSAEQKLYAFGQGFMSVIANNKTERTIDINFNPRQTNNIYSVIPLDSQTLLCQGRQSYLYNKKTLACKPLTLDNGAYILMAATGVSMNDSVFCSGHSSFYLFDRIKKNIVLYEYFNEKINTICKLNKDTLLIGTERGLLQYNIHTREKTPVTFLSDGVSIIAIEYSSQLNAFFIVLKSGKIFIADEKMTGLIKTSHDINGLSVRKVYADETGLLWLSTNKGIYTFDANFHLKAIDKEHGLPTDLINHITTGRNVVYASSESGLIIFPQTKSFFNKNPPDLYCTSIKINGKAQPIDTAYELNYNENFVKISYQALNYRTNSNVICKYILHGVDTHWQTTKNKIIEYTTLPPGKYNFELYVLNNDSIKSKQTIRLGFLIHPPYWETWWFFLLLLFIISIILFTLFKIRIQQIKKREKEKNELTRKIGETKLLALSSQMHPHFVFNSLNSIQHHVLANEPLIANKYLTKFSKLMRNVLEQSRKEQITLEEELETVTLYLEMESLRFEESFVYTITNKSNIEEKKFFVPPLIVQPIVENAIWHGLLLKKGEKKLNIVIYTDDGFLFIEVNDNGIGRNESKKYVTNKVKKESLGLKIVQERLNLLENISAHKTEITIIDKYFAENLSNGTKVTLKIPLLKSNL